MFIIPPLPEMKQMLILINNIVPVFSILGLQSTPRKAPHI
jgi:hypothetical protein